MLEWRGLIAERLTHVAERYPARTPVSIECLADMFSSSLEGGTILARLLDDNKALIDQVQAYRTHLRLVYDSAINAMSH